MKRLFALLLAATLVLTLAACGGGKDPSAPESQPQSPPAGAEPVAPSGSGEPTSQPEQMRNLQPGMISADAIGLIWDTPFASDGLWELGTEAEWEAFQTLLRTGEISHLKVSDAWADTDAELSVEKELEILQALENAQPDYFQQFENPATGGNYFIGAYDPDGNQLFVITYDGFWFTVTFPQGEAPGSYIFNGEKLNLELPSLERYRSDFGLVPGEIIPGDDPRLGGLAKHHYGTQADLDRWYDLVETAEINRFAVCRTGTTPEELPVAVEGQLRMLLRSARPALYPPETKEDPVTGGGITIIAYGGQGEQLFSASYLGNWFTVRFGEEETEAVFNGEESQELALLLTMELS